MRKESCGLHKRRMSMGVDVVEGVADLPSVRLGTVSVMRNSYEIIE